MPTQENPDVLFDDWSVPSHAYHNTRVVCDQLGLTVNEKNLICACIYQESQFNNAAICRNRNTQGDVTSTDWGLCQINDWFHVIQTKDFPSVEYILSNPEAVVTWMIGMYQKGQLRQWVSYSSGAYMHWLKANSPMWRLSPALK